MTTLSVVIPAYNEEGGIQAICERVLKITNDLKKVGVDELELIVVDDGSKDHTAEIVRSITGVSLIQQPNKGYGGALKTGFAAAHGELIGFLDADGTYPPEYFPRLCEEIFKGNELVIGSRMAGEKSEMPRVRRLGNTFFAGWITLLGRQHVTDSASGMRVFKRELLKDLYPLPDGLNLTPIMTTRAVHENLKMVEVPIPYSERVGRSKLSVVRDGSVYLQSITWTVMLYNPVRIFGMIGLAGIGFSLLVALGMTIARISGVTQLGTVGVAALYLAMVFGVAGVSIFALGVAFNYLVSLFYRRPIRQGLFGKPILKLQPDIYFGWSGLIVFILGILIGGISLALSATGWEITRLWFYLMGSAMLLIVGIQLMIFWLLLRVLDELSQQLLVK